MSACLLASAVACQSARERAEDRVALVRVGMVRPEVVDLLGEPDTRDFGRIEAGGEVWAYSYHDGIGRTVGTTIGLLIVLAPFMLLAAAASRGGGSGDLAKLINPPLLVGESTCTVQIHFNPETGKVARVVIR